MSFPALVGVELRKLRRSKILLILLAPVVIMWLTAAVNARMSFDTRSVDIAPDANFFIQGFMGMVWFMIPASLVVCCVLVTQLDRSNGGMGKMLALPISPAALSMAKFCCVVLLNLAQLVMCLAGYALAALAATASTGCDMTLSPLYVVSVAAKLYLAAIPMAAAFWLLASVIDVTVFSVGIGLATIVPSVLMINTKLWAFYPMSYPFYLLMIEYGRSADGIYETEPQLLPWLPAAAVITAVCLVISAKYFARSERR